MFIFIASMAAFSESIRALTPAEKPLRYKCQEYSHSADTATSRIKELNDSHYYHRIMYPISTYKNFYGLNIDFNVYDDSTYCFFEVETDISNSCTFIRPFIVKLPNPESDIFDKIKDLTMLDGICLNDNDRHSLVNNLKKLGSVDQLENYINDVRREDIFSTRFLASSDDMIGQIDDDELSSKLVDCYKIILSDVDTHNIINYEKMVETNLESITDQIIKPIFCRIMISPNSKFNKFMNSDEDLDKIQEEILTHINICKNALPLLHCINGFKNLIQVYVDENGFLEEKTYSKASDLVPSHQLAIWEIIKYVHSIFRDIYVAVKTCESQLVATKKTDDEIITDSDVDLSELFDNDFMGSCLITNTSSSDTKRFMPTQYTAFTHFNDSIDYTNQCYSSLNIDKLTNNEKQFILEHFTVAEYDIYKKMIPVDTRKPIFVTRNK